MKRKVSIRYTPLETVFVENSCFAAYGALKAKGKPGWLHEVEYDRLRAFGCVSNTSSLYCMFCMIPNQHICLFFAEMHEEKKQQAPGMSVSTKLLVVLHTL